MEKDTWTTEFPEDGMIVAIQPDPPLTPAELEIDISLPVEEQRCTYVHIKTKEELREFQQRYKEEKNEN